MKQKYLLILIVVVVVVPLFMYFSARKFEKPQKINQLTLAQITPQTNPPVNYDATSTQKMNDYVQNRQPLSPSDAQIRQRLTKLNNPLRNTAKFNIEYLYAPDLFQVEILDININQAKEEATAWFTNQGVSKEGICKLPVVFYLNYDVANQLRNLNVQFNPLPEGC